MKTPTSSGVGEWQAYYIVKTAQFQALPPQIMPQKFNKFMKIKYLSIFSQFFFLKLV